MDGRAMGIMAGFFLTMAVAAPGHVPGPGLRTFDLNAFAPAAGPAALGRVDDTRLLRFTDDLPDDDRALLPHAQPPGPADAPPRLRIRGRKLKLRVPIG